MKKPITIIMFLGILVAAVLFFSAEEETSLDHSTDAESSAAQNAESRRADAEYMNVLPLNLDRGVACEYEISYTGTTHVGLMGEGSANGLEMSVDIEGGVEYTALGKDGGDRLVLFHFLEGTKIEYSVGGEIAQGKDGSLSDTILEGQALVKFSQEGTVLDFRYTEDASTLFRNVAQMIVGEMQVTVLEGTEWETAEPTQHGLALSQYSLDTSLDTGRRLTRVREAYDSILAIEREIVGNDDVMVNGVWEVDVSTTEGGAIVRRLEGTETIRIGPASDPTYQVTTDILARNTTCVRTRIDPQAEVALRAATPVSLTDVSVSDDLHKNALINRVGGMTFEQMSDDLMQFGSSATMPDHNHWLYQVTGLLKLHPELCAQLVDIFAAPHFQHKARSLVLDLLGNTGNPEAQAAMRTILSSELARSDRMYPMYIQGFSLVQNPTQETGDFLLERYENGTGHESLASVTSLGAVAGNMSDHGHADIARAYSEKMIDGLKNTEDTKTQQALLLGLGNAAVESSVDAILDAGASEEPLVRVAAADALRDLDTVDSRAALYDFALDTNDRVSRQAVRSLRNHALDGSDFSAIQSMITEGRLSDSSYGEVLHLAQEHRHHDTEYRALLQSMLDHGLEDRSIEIRVRALLNQS